MTISCNLRLLIARVNVERAKQSVPPLSLRRLATESGVSLSVLAALNTGRSQRIDYMTIDHLLGFFNTYFQVTTSDLITWEQSSAAQEQFAEIPPLRFEAQTQLKALSKREQQIYD
ncbi:MAG TPA: XRE family transcriptional regulator [Ktedonobacteraceae bacterium]